MPPTSPPPALRRLSYFHDALALCTLDFPIYCVEFISERHVVVAGGGGSSKTGVHNQIDVMELVPSKGSCYADLVTKYTIPDECPDAIMTAALMPGQTITETSVVTGGEYPAIYTMKFDSTSRAYNVTDYEMLNKDKPNEKIDVKCVKYAPGKIITGFTDGHLTCWKGGKVTNKVKAHAKEIDDIDVNLKNGHLVTLSRGDGRFIIWNLNTFHKIHEYSNKDMKRSNGVSYTARSCRYAYDRSSDTTSDSNQDVSLLIAYNPVPAKNQPCMIYKWSMKDDDCKLLDSGRPVVADGIMAMSVSQDGQHVAIGTRSGGVSVFLVKNLGQVYKVDSVHHNAVTNLAFLPPKQESRTLTNCKLCPLLSVSIDRRVVLHRPRSNSNTAQLLKTVLMLIVIFFLFFALSSHYNTRSSSSTAM